MENMPSEYSCVDYARQNRHSSSAERNQYVDGLTLSKEGGTTPNECRQNVKNHNERGPEWTKGVIHGDRLTKPSSAAPGWTECAPCIRAGVRWSAWLGTLGQGPAARMAKPRRTAPAEPTDQQESIVPEATIELKKVRTRHGGSWGKEHSVPRTRRSS